MISPFIPGELSSVARPGTGCYLVKRSAMAIVRTPGLRSHWQIVCVTFHTPETVHNMAFVSTPHAGWFHAFDSWLRRALKVSSENINLSFNISKKSCFKNRIDGT